MDPNIVKVVTNNNVTSEDIKPEGRTDGPNNFGPEFVTNHHTGLVVPTRPAQQTERVARAIAQATREEGGDEAEVARSFAGSLPEHEAVIPPSQQHIPDYVAASTPKHLRKEEKADKSKKALKTDAERQQYDIGVGLAHTNKALPLEASDALERGYTETRESMREQVQNRRENETSDLLQHKSARERKRLEKEAAAKQEPVPVKIVGDANNS